MLIRRFQGTLESEMSASSSNSEFNKHIPIYVRDIGRAQTFDLVGARPAHRNTDRSIINSTKTAQLHWNLANINDGGIFFDEGILLHEINNTFRIREVCSIGTSDE